MRATLVVLLALALAAPGLAADRPQPPETFAPIADAVKSAVFSVVLPGDEPGRDESDRREVTPSEDEILRQLFDALARLPNRTLGAAVMIESSGIAVTSARILHDATIVDVVALDGRRYGAAVIGRDERTDVAVLRVTAPRPLPIVRLGNSDEVRVGDWVLAVGSPYGFEASVSAGIVSARARVGPEGPYGDMLQTDAAVNVGSAGGPLVDTHGAMVGLTARAAPRGSGIAFAVPSNLVRKVTDDIVAQGRVVRSWLGIASQPLTAALARAFHVPFTSGLLTTDVVRGGPAARAGLARGVAVLAVDGRPLRTLDDLEHALGATAPGRTATLRVWRNEREETVSVVLGEEPDPRHASGWTRRLRGLVVEGITPEVGVFVSAVMPGTPAADAGVLPGDVVREVDQQTIRGTADFDAAVGAIRSSRSVTLLVQRGRTPFYAVLVSDR
jgi:serine protease Do